MPDSDAPPRGTELLHAVAAPAREVDLARRLDILRDEAEEHLHTPLRPLPDSQRGYIETVACDEAGMLWVSGWLHRDQPLEFPAVILDRHKIPAAVALAAYARDDLPSEAHAVVGAVRADWRPSAPDAEPFLFFGEGMRLYQRGVRPMRQVEMREIAELFERVRGRSTGTPAAALQRLLASPENWLPDTARVAGFPAHAAVDRLLVLGAFGCLAEGWAMSPVKRVARLALRCGDRVLHSDPRATYTRPRPDLRDAYPGCGGPLADRAGFVTAFRGRLDPAEVVDPVLKVVFADGTSTNHPVPPGAMRRIGHSAAVEEALALFPSLTHEAFFGDFALALGQEAAGRIGAPEPWRVAPCDRAVVLAVPRDRSDAYLLIEEARHLAGRGALAPGDGLVLLAERGGSRPDVLALFQGLVEAAAPCSLFFVEDVDQALHTAGEALRAVGAGRFLFLGPQVALSSGGWRAGLEALASRDGGEGALHLLAVPDGGSGGPADVGEAAARGDAFAWSTAAFLAALPHLPVLPGGGRHGDNGLRAAAERGGARVVPRAADGHRQDGGRGASALTARIDGAIAGAGPRRAPPGDGDEGAYRHA